MGRSWVRWVSAGSCHLANQCMITIHFPNKQCLLVNSSYELWKGYTLPCMLAAYDDTPLSAAMRTVYQVLGVESEQVRLIHSVPPVMLYNPRCGSNEEEDTINSTDSGQQATIYLAYSNNPPPAKDAQEGADDSEMAGKTYDLAIA
jgi:hypothetical protein